jgi:hypothetical protein
MKKSRAGTMTHDYKRHETTTLFAALSASRKHESCDVFEFPIALAHHGRSPTMGPGICLWVL